MLSKIKDSLSGKKTDELASSLDETKKVLAEQANTISELKADLDAIHTATKQILNDQEKVMAFNHDATKSLKNLTAEFTQSINDVKLLASTIQNTLSRKVTDAIVTLTQEVSSKLSGSEKLKRELEHDSESIKTELKDLHEEIKKLKTISSKINAADFELVRFTSQLKSSENDKLRLLKQIDSLQRLVAGLRRR